MSASYPDSGDSAGVIDSSDGCPEEVVSDVGGLGGVLSLFPHRHWGQVFGSCSGRSGMRQGPGSLLLALPMPEGG